ncbi:MAG: glycoside hydrolase family 5 protein, partial [Verrucomicrobia bacterium]|nr:glycoside hydrolase family 5 protein [Verrucomicrobiota bacterium]
MHWATFARRYRGVPNSRLSFNLFNEPAHVSPERHAHVVKLVADAIRAEDPARLIICDAREWGNVPSPELVPLKVAQATRGYQPMGVTHCKASWVNGENMPAPPGPSPRQRFPAPPECRRPAELPADRPRPTPRPRLSCLRVAEGLGSATLLVAADGTPVFGKEFATGPAGQGEWKASKFHDQWKAHQCAYDREYEVSLPPGTRTVTLSNTNGTWISLAAVPID